MHWLSKSRAAKAGGIGTGLLAAWKWYANYTTALNLPETVRAVLRVLESGPPLWLLAPFLALLAYGLWPSRRPALQRQKIDIEPRAESVVAGDSYEAEVAPAPRRELTMVDRERCALAFQELHDFVNGDLKHFYQSLASSGNAPNKLEPFWNSLDRLRHGQNRRYVEFADLLQRHWHYFEIVKLDLGPVLRGIDAINGKLGAVAQAQDWPAEAQSDRLADLSAANGEMWSNAMALMHAMHAKREEYGI